MQQNIFDFCLEDRPEDIDQIRCRFDCPDYDQCTVSGYLSEIGKNLNNVEKSEIAYGTSRFELIGESVSPPKSHKYSDLLAGQLTIEEQIRAIILDKCFVREDAQFYDGEYPKGTARTVSLITQMKLINEEGEAISPHLIGIRAKLKCGKISKPDWDMLDYQNHCIESFIDDVAGVIYRYRTEKIAMLDEIKQAWSHICKDWDISKSASNKIVKIVLDDYKRSLATEEESPQAIIEQEQVVIQELLQKYEEACLFPDQPLFRDLSDRKKIGNLSLVFACTDFFQLKETSENLKAKKAFEKIKNHRKSFKKHLRNDKTWLSQEDLKTGETVISDFFGKVIPHPPKKK